MQAERNYKIVKNEPVPVTELRPELRSASFAEVNPGYTEDEAAREASRCLQCANPLCVQGCPVSINIKKFIYYITKKDYKAAYLTIRKKNDFPSICGRICPAEYQCRKACVLNKKIAPFASKESINIHFLERFIGDYGIKNDLTSESTQDMKLSAYKAAIVGSGPAGICCAGELARHGIQVTIYEALHDSGGVLRYGIPPFRLPRDILDREIDYLRKNGVRIMTNNIIGKTKTLNDIFSEGFHAIFLGLGAGVPSFLNIKGENLCNIYSANEFLTRVNLMSAYEFPKYHTPVNIGRSTIVIGGGNTAMDAARSSIRMQKMAGLTPDTTILYRRTELEMPARRFEIEHAKEEGVKFRFLVKPEEFTADEKGFVKSLRCVECALGEIDSSGRRRPVTIKDSGFELRCDLAIIAIGLAANQVLTSVTPEIITDKNHDVIITKDTMLTSVKNVYAGGDIVGGEGTVIEAMGMAKKASAAIIEDFIKKNSNEK